jgi:hypothetical protein
MSRYERGGTQIKRGQRSCPILKQDLLSSGNLIDGNHAF